MDYIEEWLLKNAPLLSLGDIVVINFPDGKELCIWDGSNFIEWDSGLYLNRHVKLKK